MTIVVSGKHGKVAVFGGNKWITTVSAGKSVLGRDSRATSVNSNGDMFVYHTLPEVTSVYPNTVRP